MATTIALTLPSLTAAAETAFTVTRLREFVSSGLSDAALQVYLDAAFDAIDDALGPLTVHEHLHARGELLRLSREAESITTIVEDARWSALTLAADDYELSDSGQMLTRLHDGTNPRWCWHGRVDVTYVRARDVAEEIRVAVALVQLELNNRPGLISLSTEGYSETFAGNSVMNYQIERDLILATLNRGGAAAI
jgi:hypothetical protein